VLKAQHYKLCERFRQKEKLRQILEKRVEELEGRQAKDDEVACIINRYWNRLDEDVSQLTPIALPLTLSLTQLFRLAFCYRDLMPMLL